MATLGTLPTATELGALVEVLSRDVERIRGFRFTHSVPIEVRTSAQISSYFRGQLAQPSVEQQWDELLMIALGYVAHESSRDADALARMMSTEAQGFYDTDRGLLVLPESEARVLMRPGPAGLDARTTVVHELAHALQQQHFATRVTTQSNAASLSENAGVRLALLEGDATLVGLEWTARQRGSRLLQTEQLRPRVQRWADRAQLLTELDIAPYILAAMEQPYEAGTLAAAQLFELGGWASINRALSDLALCSGALLHPDRPAETPYILDPIPAHDVPAQMTLLTSRRLGELELRLFLESLVRKERAWALASTWRGDTVYLYRSADSKLAVQWMIACDSVQGAQELVTASQPVLNRWMRVGCPLVRGGSEHQCPATITREDTTVIIRRGT